MRRWTLKLLAAVVGVWSAMLLRPALAENLNFKVTSNYGDVVQIHFYSYTRSREWPTGSTSYTLVDNATHSISLACDPGEHICYGAWVKTDIKINWGVGFRKQRRCTSCCYYCDGGSPRVTLNP